MSILASLTDYYDVLLARSDVPSRGYSWKSIGAVLVISPEGQPKELISWQDTSGKKPVPRREIVPGERDHDNSIDPFFLWDKTAYSLGVTAIETDGEITPGQARRTAQEHAAFVASHEEKLAGAVDAGLIALLRFLQGWSWDQYPALEDKGFTPELLDQNVAFRLDGDEILLHERPAARDLWKKLQTEDGEKTTCLVTGQMAVPARLHPQLKGVMDAQSSGASLVSFNIDAFGSFGKAQGDNAPVSKQAAFAYGAALNWLLSRGSGRNFRVGDTTTVFWAEETGTGEDAADAAETMMSLNFSSLQDVDADAQSDISDRLDKMAKGRPLAEIDPRLDAGTRMCVLGLSPNNARLAVRFWFVETFGKLAENFASHHHDLAIEPNTFKQPPQVWSLLYETAAQRKVKNIPPRLGGEIMRAVLTGARYPHTLLTAIIGRIRADKTVNGPRAAMCKAVINRDLRLSTTGKSKAENKEIPVALDETNVNTAYLLGRLFSLYEEAEAGVAKRNATIRDRYFGAASATPARVYPILMRGYGHNISKLGKGERAGQAVNIEKAVTGVIGHLTDVLPRTLALEDQGRFVVGYYHQQQQRFTKKTTDTSSPKSE